jgi:hypothetical protein
MLHEDTMLVTRSDWYRPMAGGQQDLTCHRFSGSISERALMSTEQLRVLDIGITSAIHQFRIFFLNSRHHGTVLQSVADAWRLVCKRCHDWCTCYRTLLEESKSSTGRMDTHPSHAIPRHAKCSAQVLANSLRVRVAMTGLYDLAVEVVRGEFARWYLLQEHNIHFFEGPTFSFWEAKDTP